MSDLGWHHRIHGQKQHDNMCIFIEKHIVIHGGKVKDPSVFKKRIPPCEPDVYFEYTDHGKTYLGVAEVETNATKESVERKQRQYELTLKGVVLYIFDLKKGFDKYGEAIFRDIPTIQKWIDEEMPL